LLALNPLIDPLCDYIIAQPWFDLQPKRFAKTIEAH
jgi:hypothetical protein